MQKVVSSKIFFAAAFLSFFADLNSAYISESLNTHLDLFENQYFWVMLALSANFEAKRTVNSAMKLKL